MSVFTKHAADLGKLEVYNGTERATLNWAGTDYPCLSGSRGSTGKDNQEGGWFPNNLLRIVLRREVFGDDIPEEQQSVIFTMNDVSTPETYNIQSVTIAAGGKQVHLVLENPAKGA